MTVDNKTKKICEVSFLQRSEPRYWPNAYTRCCFLLWRKPPLGTSPPQRRQSFKHLELVEPFKWWLWRL